MLCGGIYIASRSPVRGEYGMQAIKYALRRMNNGKIRAYEFYRRVGNGQDHFVGTLPERRKDPARITEETILNWARSLFSRMNEEEFRKDVYFVQVEI